MSLAVQDYVHMSVYDSFLMWVVANYRPRPRACFGKFQYQESNGALRKN